ncbi:hypothetical protein LA080_007006 [Diaporthe eres]|nr:hypothetical protein LA080_007006 [Diaporthe eres]
MTTLHFGPSLLAPFSQLQNPASAPIPPPTSTFSLRFCQPTTFFDLDFRPSFLRLSNLPSTPKYYTPQPQSSNKHYLLSPTVSVLVSTGSTSKLTNFSDHRVSPVKLPIDIPILDTATIFLTFTGKVSYPTLGRALQRIGYTVPPSVSFHNAANHAWLTLELLFLEAEQAVKQLTDLDGKETIDWMVAPAAPPSSPSRGTIPKEVYDSSLSTPTYFNPNRLKKSAQSSSPPDSQAPHIPSGGTKRRQKKRNRANSEVSANGNTVNSTAAATPTDGDPPTKKQKLTHESDVTEKEGGRFHGGGAVERNGGSGDGKAETALTGGPS